MNDINSNIQTANERSFNSTFYNEPLTAFTVGWKDPSNLEALLEFVAPAVPVGRRFEYRKADNKEAFYSDTQEDIRSIGSCFKQVRYSGEVVNEKTLNKGLTVRVDHDEITTEDWQERYVEMLMQRLYRNELRRAISLLDDNATNNDVTWTNTSIPDKDIRSLIRTGAKDIGFRPNRLLVHENVWDARSSIYESKTNALYTAATTSKRDIAERFGVETAEIFSFHYNGGLGGTKSEPGADTAYVFSGSNTLVKDAPSNLKRFYTPQDNGAKFRVYVDEQTKYTDVSVEHYSNTVLTSNVGLKKTSFTLPS